MHKLLIASQKGGVGKTTTVVNLAMIAATAGKRVLLVDADPLGSVAACLKLSRKDGKGRAEPVHGSGWWWKGVLPNLDVVTPYSATSQSDEDLKAFLEKFPESDFHAHFDQAFVDSPPALLGDRTKTLLRTCDELLIVIRAEPMAYRTLPGYLEELQNAQEEGASCTLKGILLTMPQGMEEDSEWEHQLRTRFGKNVFAEIVPHDPEANRAVLVGKPITALHPDSPASKVYISLAKSLGILRSEKKRVQNLEDASVSPDRIAPMPRFHAPAPAPAPATVPAPARPKPPLPNRIPTAPVRANLHPSSTNVALAELPEAHRVANRIPHYQATLAPQTNTLLWGLSAVALGLIVGLGVLILTKP